MNQSSISTRSSTTTTTTRRRGHGPSPTTHATTGNSNNSSTAHDAHSITKSLHRTQNLLKHELERVSHVSQAMEQDSQILGDTKTHHFEMKDTVRGAKGALTQLERAKQKERGVLMLSVVFFYIVVLYVLWTRIRIPFLLW